MPVSDKKRKTDYEWKKANKGTISCTMYRGDVDAFKNYCAGRGQSVNDNLKEYVSACLGRPLEKREGPRKKADPEDVPEVDDMPE